MANHEANYNHFRFAEVYRPVFTGFTVDDADTCSKIIRAFVNASHFRLSAWRLNYQGLPDEGNRLILQSRDANAVLRVVNTYRHSDVSQSHGQVFEIVITAPRYLSDRALDALVHEIDLDGANKVTIELADVLGQFDPPLRELR